MPFRRLDPQKIIATAQKLEGRIAERFPKAGLRGVGRELVSLSRDTSIAAERLSRPVLWLRFAVGAAILAGAAVFGMVGSFLTFERMASDGADFVQGIEAVINTLVLAGVGLFTLIRMEQRFKRNAAFKGLHALRSMVHIIDMHQLTKDPGALSRSFKPTKSSPERTLGREELLRYLDYCSEMLSLCGKLAALYAQSVNDEVVVNAVNDIEALAGNLSRKIWQKITLAGEVPATARKRAV